LATLGASDEDSIRDHRGGGHESDGAQSVGRRVISNVTAGQARSLQLPHKQGWMQRWRA
jgi:hypothetical protein